VKEGKEEKTEKEDLEDSVDESVDESIKEEAEAQEGEDSKKVKEVKPKEEEKKKVLLEEAVKGEFKAKIPTKDLKSFVSVVNSLVDEARLTITEKGVEVISMDLSQIALIKANLSYKDFAVFKLQDTKEMSVCLDFQEWNEVLKKIDEEYVELVISDVQYRLHSDTIDFRGSMLGDSTSKPPKTPSIEYQGYFKFDKADTLSKILKKSIGNHLRFEYQNGGMFFISESETARMCLKANLKDVNFKGDNIKAVFSVDMLENIAKGLKGKENVEVKLGNDRPMCMAWKEGEIYLAPRIDVA
jgi:DNA polymerase III sliding clamp (beta) subunit (PCNA family)